MILIALGLTRREQDAVVHTNRSRREHGQAQQLTDLVVVRALHDLLTTQAKVLKREGVQRTEPDHLLLVDAQLFRGAIPCFLCGLLAEGHESNLVGRRSTVQFFLNDVDQPCSLARAWGSKDCCRGQNGISSPATSMAGISTSSDLAGTHHTRIGMVSPFVVLNRR